MALINAGCNGKYRADLGRPKFWSLHRRYRLGPTTDHSIPVHCGGDIHQFVSDHDATNSSAVVRRLKSLAPVLRARRGLSVPLTTRDGPRHGEVAETERWVLLSDTKVTISDSQMSWLRPIPGAVRTEDPRLGRLVVQQEICVFVLSLSLERPVSNVHK